MPTRRGIAVRNPQPDFHAPRHRNRCIEDESKNITTDSLARRSLNPINPRLGRGRGQQVSLLSLSAMNETTVLLRAYNSGGCPRGFVRSDASRVVIKVRFVPGLAGNDY